MRVCVCMRGGVGEEMNGGREGGSCHLLQQVKPESKTNKMP